MRKQMLVSILILLAIKTCQHANADQLAVALITHHVYDLGFESRKYDGCVSGDCRTIVNPVLAYRTESKLDLIETDDYGRPLQDQQDFYKSRTMFAGVNSIHEIMVGYLWSAGLTHGNSKYGLSFGGYVQDERKFNDRGIEVLLGPRIGNWSAMPIFGLEHQHKLTKKIFTNTLITPVIINFGVGMEI